MLQKVQYDAAGKLSELFNCIFSNYKITPSSSKGENEINKVIILDTKNKNKKINQMQGNQDKELPYGSR